MPSESIDSTPTSILDTLSGKESVKVEHIITIPTAVLMTLIGGTLLILIFKHFLKK